MNYTLIRSSRKTIALQVKSDGSVIVRAPQRMSQKLIDEFVKKHEAWVQNKLEKVQQTVDDRLEVSEEQRKAGVEKALQVIPQKVAFYARKMGVTYGRITIREQKTRWGSCSSKGNLNFNWKLMLLPEELLDYVVVHELAHRKEMNHSDAFWKIVQQEMPDYLERRKQLKQVRI